MMGSSTSKTLATSGTEALACSIWRRTSAAASWIAAAFCVLILWLGHSPLRLFRITFWFAFGSKSIWLLCTFNKSLIKKRTCYVVHIMMWTCTKCYLSRTIRISTQTRTPRRFAHRPHLLKTTPQGDYHRPSCCERQKAVTVGN